ncbi:MAG: TetR/AcrR family transcriptional regulator [Candidatus Kapaibacterium sp.]|nr:MAG: TetR/AcrR family transcriptional regulator [Candidatus Kapabacteria bacterium]
MLETHLMKITKKTAKPTHKEPSQGLPEAKLGTKERIVETSRILFNEHGVEAVTVRHIADAVGISHGNLCYHFPRKEDIILRHYHAVVEGMNAQVAAWNPEHLNLSMILDALLKSYELQYHHKFLMVEFVNIMRRIPEIREHFRSLFAVRKQQFGFALMLLQHKNIIKEMSDVERERISLHNYLMGDFWMSEAEILYAGEESEKCRFYAHLASALLYPYLTARGRKEFDAFWESE